MKYGTCSPADKPFESRHDSLVEVRMLHVAVVDKEILMHAFLAGRLRFAHKTVYLA